MTLHYPRIYRLVLCLSLLLAGLWLVSGHEYLEFGIFAVLMVATGIPHGATDHVIDRFQNQQQGNGFSWGKFLLTYLGAMLMYGLVWYFMPLLSLTIFIGISAYHFGQSQLMYIRESERNLLKQVSYMSWGLLVLGGIIGFHPAKSSEILAALLDQSLLYNWEVYLWPCMGLLGLIWLGSMWGFWTQGRVSLRELSIELGQLLLLLGIAYSTSLLVSFAIYFGLWHSLASISHEISIFREAHSQFSLRDFVKQALPFSVLSFVGIALLLAIGQWMAAYVSPYLLFFIAISTLTLPHMIFMQGFYQLRIKQSRTPLVG